MIVRDVPDGRLSTGANKVKMPGCACKCNKSTFHMRTSRQQKLMHHYVNNHRGSMVRPYACILVNCIISCVVFIWWLICLSWHTGRAPFWSIFAWSQNDVRVNLFSLPDQCWMWIARRTTKNIEWLLSLSVVRYYIIRVHFTFDHQLITGTFE